MAAHLAGQALKAPSRLVDQTRISPDAAKVTGRPFRGRLRRAVVSHMHVGSHQNRTIRVGDRGLDPR
jgi:hypothetical protein